ncbi:DNA mismatch repair endonuclease MutL [Lewinella sp. 4G2]|uniref:DNA mismatch repair endonuclease MutL n=1 Tax=Lewinella sp. 4G2 TaxID=1803372 RepID=UPI0007B4CBBE|nr:DNA mismatch repair endonuclease MutL [Lewinella sp. 4G2]OAV43793.1 DNA mismatch repair protein MutL [Lewinella sp. 4G2]
MTDNLVHLLPDAIANQIAAGEVIQRPSSVVKELVENAIDSGASEIELAIKDSGKTLIQVRDNGCGMSETDARMALERHATSKLRSADDLFNLRTMGFRGEALPSIAAVAQLEIKTRRAPDELGTRILVEGSEVKVQEPVAAPAGTTMAVRNLFFNVPARRNFLKSDTVELRHIRDEFIRIALAYPGVRFDLIVNDRLDLALPIGKLRQRVVQVFGRKYDSLLVPIDEDTDVLQITGYVGKPEAARKSRVGQFFFINDRFIKSSYLHHAVVGAYDDLLNKDSYPFYVIYMRIDPARIDVNVHPTKQEIKFEDERMIYNYLKATIRHGLGRASIMPSIDFEVDNVFSPSKTAPAATVLSSRLNADTEEEGEVLGSKMNADYSPPRSQFPGTRGSAQNSGSSYQPSGSEAQRQANNLRHWEELYRGLGGDSETTPDNTIDFQATDEFGAALVDLDTGEILQSKVSEDVLPSRVGNEEETPGGSAQDRKPYQLHGRYIVSPIKSGWLLIDQRTAHQRILYERFLRNLETIPAASQQSLFPQTVELPHADVGVMTDLLPDLKLLGFDVEPFGGNSFIIRGIPAEIAGHKNEKEILERLLQQYRDDVDLSNSGHQRLAKALARNAAIRRGAALDVAEMRSLMNQLFACEQPQTGPSGGKTFVKYELEEVDKLFAS